MPRGRKGKKDIEQHWFLDRWCAEMAVERWMRAGEAARRAGTTTNYVGQAVRRVYGCSTVQARRKMRIMGRKETAAG